MFKIINKMTLSVKRIQHFTVVSMNEIEHDKLSIIKGKSRKAHC